ncbi:MAG: hypothetical protein NVSMB57_13100 [Actinomycetota bacterium]
MERMPGGRSDTWAVWKSAVLGLPDDAIDEYLAHVEGFTPSRIASFRANDSAVVPSDWDASGDARAAITRLFAFRRQMGTRGDLAGPDAQQQNRGAAVPPSSHPPQRRENELFVVGLDEAQGPAPSGSPDAVESNASKCGAAAASGVDEA